MPSLGLLASCGPNDRVLPSLLTPRIVARAEPTTIWRPMKAGVNSASPSVRVVIAGAVLVLAVSP